MKTFRDLKIGDTIYILQAYYNNERTKSPIFEVQPVKITSINYMYALDYDKKYHLRCVLHTDFLNLNIINCIRTTVYLRPDEMNESLSSFYASTDYELLKKQVDLANL